MINKKKTLFCMVGFIVALLIFEASLRFIGFAYRNYRINKNISNLEDKNTVRILCLGDSFTFGIGAQKGYSYPEQLEKMLNAKSEQTFIVHNAGVPGSNSSYLYKHMEENIKEYNPHIIVLLTGCNNNSNFVDSNYFLFLDTSSKTCAYSADAFLSRFKTYKFFKMVICLLVDKINYLKNNAIGQGTKNKTIISPCGSNVNKKTNSPFSSEAKMRLELAKQYDKESKFKLALSEVRRSIELDPDDSQAYAFLGFLLVHRIVDLQSAIISLKKAIELDPCNTDAMGHLFFAYHRTNNLNSAREVLERLKHLNPQNTYFIQLLAHGIPRYKDLRPFQLMLTYDLQNIYDLVEENKLILIVQNYFNDWPNDTINDFAHLHSNVFFVDNSTVFRNFQRKEDYLAEDGHYNEKGYGIIASNLFKLIKSININSK